MNNINYITVIPKTQYTAFYYLDDSTEAHAKKLEDLKEFILKLIDKKIFYQRIDDLIYSFQSFIVDVENKIITELETDLEESFKEHRESLRNIKPYATKEVVTKKDKFESLGQESIFKNFTY